MNYNILNNEGYTNIMTTKSLINKHRSNPLIHKEGEKKLKYNIRAEPIGTGSFSEVFYATDKDNKEYAIKRISISKLDESRMDKFELELNISRDIDHFNIVKCYDTFKTDKHWYIVTEYCNAKTFAELINDFNIKKIDMKEREILCNFYLGQLKEALEYLYDNKIFHRDLKPRNILLKKIKTGELVVKLADFGFARFFENNDNDKQTDILTATICGTPIYMSPELLVDCNYNMKADLWSFGIIMYEILHGTNPYNFPKGLVDITNWIKKNSIKIDDKLSDKCKDLLNRLLKIDPKDRIEWNDFFEHIWFSSFDQYDPDSDSDSSKSSKSSMISCRSESNIYCTTNAIEEYEYIEDYIPNQTSEYNDKTINEYFLKKSEVFDKYIMIDDSKITRKSEPIPVPKKEIQNKREIKKYIEKESIGGSVIKILSDSVSFIFSLSKSY